MKIYCDFQIQLKRINDLLQCSFNHNLLEDISFTNKITECDLILFLVNSSKSLRNIDKLDKKKEKIDNNDIIYQIKSTCNDNIKRKDYFKYNKPIILLERLDSSVTWIRELEKYKNIIGIFKNRIVRNNNYNNQKLFSGRYHAKLITDSLAKKDIIPVSNKSKKKVDLATQFFSKFKTLDKITDEDFKKFHPVLFDFMSSPLSKKMKFYKDINKINNNNLEKDIDVFCVHTIRPGVIGKHRLKAINIIKNIKDISYKTDKCSEDVYKKDFINSKICVACWGFGEWTHMDGYAMYSKTILIKPNTDYVFMDPDLYNSKRYIPCKPDFSDLENIIKNILSNYGNYQNMLDNNYNFIKSIDDIHYTKKFWNKIKQVYNDSKK